MNREFDIKFFKDNGWVKIENFTSKSEIRNLKKKINEFLKKNYNKYTGRDINFLSEKKNWNNINSFHKLHDCNFILKFSQKKKNSKIGK